MPTASETFGLGAEQATVALDITLSSGGTVVSGHQANGFTVPAGETWEISGLVTTPKNVIVAGTLRMRPGATLRFVNVDEDAFVLGTMQPVASDVGLWILAGGRLDAHGTPKTAWSRLSVGAAAGDSVITLEGPPTNWQVGDELVICPSAPPDPAAPFGAGDAFKEFEERAIIAVAGNQVTLNAPLTYPKPLAFGGSKHRGITLGTEVLNLARDVTIEGTESGRTHTIFVGMDPMGHHAAVPQSVGYVRFNHMGPHTSKPVPVAWSEHVESVQWVDQATGQPIRLPALGRWPVHFHHGGTGVAGSVMEGLVSVRAGSHAFIAHESTDVTWKACIAYDSTTAPFWWDGSEGRMPHPSKIQVLPPDKSFDIVYDRCVAARTRSFNPKDVKIVAKYRPGWSAADMRDPSSLFWPEINHDRMGDYQLAKNNGTIRNSVSVGSLGGRDTAGMGWVAQGAGPRWDIEGFVSHNGWGHGSFGWQNTDHPHFISRLLSYRNRGFGVFHGAYKNPYQWTDIISSENRDGGLNWHANSPDTLDQPGDPRQHWLRCTFDGPWMSLDHRLNGLVTTFEECVMLDQVLYDEEGADAGSQARFLNCDMPAPTVVHKRPATTIEVVGSLTSPLPDLPHPPLPGGWS